MFVHPSEALAGIYIINIIPFRIPTGNSLSIQFFWVCKDLNSTHKRRLLAIPSEGAKPEILVGILYPFTKLIERGITWMTICFFFHEILCIKFKLFSTLSSRSNIEDNIGKQNMTTQFPIIETSIIAVRDNCITAVSDFGSCGWHKLNSCVISDNLLSRG